MAPAADSSDIDPNAGIHVMSFNALFQTAPPPAIPSTGRIVPRDRGAADGGPS